MSVAGIIRRATGFRWFERNRRGWEARFNWADVTGSWGLSLALCSFEEGFSLHIHLGYPNAFIKLPFLRRWHREPEEIMEAWGFSLDRDSWSAIHLNWGARTKIVHLPWDWDHHRTSHLLADGTWRHETAAKQREVNRQGREAALAYHDECWAAREQRWQAEYAYRHVLSKPSERGEPAGAEQWAVATINVDEMEWRRRWLRWTRLGRKVRRSISVSFSDELGSRAGSWKGGTIGCGYDMRPGETPLDTLRRMERERSFDR